MAFTDDVLVSRLREARGWRRVELASQLGASQGADGPAALRSLLAERGRGSTDVRCAALLALGKRRGADATEDFGMSLRGPAAVHDYALCCLAAWGDERFWGQVQESLARWFHRPRMSEPSLFVACVTYLARGAADDRDRRRRLSELVETHAHALPADDGQWLRRHWAAPSELGSQTPDVQGMQAEWLSQAIFQPLDEQDQ